MPTPPPPSLFPKLVNDAGSEDRSSQLPSVDEAKLQASLKSPQSRTVSASDDDSLPGIKQSGTDRTSFDYGFDDDEEMSVHDQLPALEDMKLYANDNGRRCGTNAKVLGFCVVFLLACAVLVMIVLLGVPVDDEAPRISSSSSSSSSSSNGGDEGVGFPEQPSAPANQSVVVLDDTDTADSTTSATSEETEMITEEPTETPYVDRYTHLIEILSNGGISSMEDLVAPGSPQQKAAQFIANDDGRQISLAAENKSSLIQRYVLTVMYHGLGGEQWTNRLNFLANDDECNWFVLGLGPDKKTQTYGVSCFRSGNVQTLHFPSKFVTGVFPPEMVHLTYLERLDIFSNPGLAEFPLLKGMPWLKYLGLHYCQLESTIPEWIGTLTKLETLALSNNFLTGTLPKSMSTMARLEKLYVDDNNLEGDIGFLGSIPSLRHVVVEDNMFTGGLSDELFLNLPLLEVFDASKNPIDSTIPASLMALEKLRVLDCHSCNLHGSIPSFNDPNFQNTALEVLVLASNSLTGSIPEQISNYMGLRQLDLSKNQLAFTIPSSLANLQKLEYFYAALNNFEPGEIPTFLYTMTNLKDLSLKATSRIGSIPEAIGSLSQLTMLDLDSNDLVSSIPTAIGKLTSLEYLLLNRNMLQGTLPPDLELLSKLDFFMIDKNGITGDAETVCNMLTPPKTFVADCAGESPELNCRCCTICCSDGNSTCNDEVWLDEINPIWELGYVDTGKSFDGSDQVYDIIFQGDIP